MAEQLRLKILTTGYIYDVELRPARFAATTNAAGSSAHRTDSQLQKSLYQNHRSGDESARGHRINDIEQLRESIEKIEKAVLASARELPVYSKLTSLPGVGKILGMTITMEVGDIKRFAGPGNFASYLRTVEAKRTSNTKKKGENNSKCVEAKQ